MLNIKTDYTSKKEFLSISFLYQHLETDITIQTKFLFLISDVIFQILFNIFSFFWTQTY